MNKSAQNVLTGAALAMAMAGMSQMAYAGNAEQGASSTDLVHCYGVNMCGGHNDCKTANNACSGKASCKGQGFVAMPSKACGDVGGEVKDEWRGEVSKAELVQCYGVNTCKGHNDCKTADNACAGHASCKGHGFVNTSAKSCTDIGGKTNG